jgi:hypothetical protein
MSYLDETELTTRAEVTSEQMRLLTDIRDLLKRWADRGDEVYYRRYPGYEYWIDSHELDDAANDLQKMIGCLKVKEDVNE